MKTLHPFQKLAVAKTIWKIVVKKEEKCKHVTSLAFRQFFSTQKCPEIPQIEKLLLHSNQELCLKLVYLALHDYTPET